MLGWCLQSGAVSDFRRQDCSGELGTCTGGHCGACKPGWTGPLCGVMKLKLGRVAYTDPLWTWGGSPIVDVVSTFGLILSPFSAVLGGSCVM